MNTKNEEKSMFSEFTFRGEGGGSAQKDQRFTYFIDIELWTQSLNLQLPQVAETADNCWVLDNLLLIWMTLFVWKKDNPLQETEPPTLITYYKMNYRIRYN